MRRPLVFFVFLLSILLPSLSSTQRLSKSRVEILRVGQFHGKEVSAKSGEIWFGLYPTKDGYELISSKIVVDTVCDHMIGENAGKKVQVDRSTKPLFLVKGSESLKGGVVKTVFSGIKFLYPAESMEFKFGEKDYYILVGFGEALDRGVAKPFDIAIRNYRIEVSHYPWVNKQVIASFDIVAMDGLPTLLWAGDLDRDGKLDLLLDLTNHYNVSEYTLFLSSMAEGDSLLQKVAKFRSVGC
jgi:hypothetical protein